MKDLVELENKVYALTLKEHSCLENGDIMEFVAVHQELIAARDLLAEAMNINKTLNCEESI